MIFRRGRSEFAEDQLARESPAFEHHPPLRSGARWALYCVLGTALGERDRQKLQEPVCKVLHVLGLVNACPVDDDSDADQGKEEVLVGIGDWAPTHQLLLLAAIRADKDHDRWWIKFLEL